MPNFRISPPPTANEDKGIWAVWYMQVKDAINRIGESFSWTLLNFTGSNLTDIETRNHNDLLNSQGGNATQHYHLTLAQHTDLTDAGDSTSHYHASDRDSANFTGTNWTDLTDGSTTSLHTHIISGTPVTASGRSINFTSIPSWVKRITLMCSSISTTGTSNLLVQIGDSGGIETTGYLGTSSNTQNNLSPTAANYTTGFGVLLSNPANSIHGNIVLSLLDSTTNLWVASGTFGFSNAAVLVDTAGSKSLSATLDRIRLTTLAGADTFDAGTVNILYE